MARRAEIVAPRMPLSDASLRAAKPREKAYRLSDGGGLYAEISPSGGKWWRLKYRYGGKEKRISLGTYPAVGLKEARERRDAARRLLADGKDPSQQRKAEKAAQLQASENTFEAVAREWVKQQDRRWKAGHAAKVLRRLEMHTFPTIGDRPLTEITAREILPILRRIEARGHIENAHRVCQYTGAVFRYAIACGRAENDPTAALRGALKTQKARHHPSITDPAAIGALLRAIDGYTGEHATSCALRFAPLVFVRPGELRRAKWEEIDLEGAEWRIPAERMKMNAPHIVPLSSQAVAALEAVKPLTGRSAFVFPSLRSSKRPMSENTLNAALRRLGYAKEEMTAHGFRSMASTLLNEMGWHRDAIERQLAHAERDAVRAAYNYAEHLPERRRMMQAWADYLDRLREGGGKVTPIHARA